MKYSYTDISVFNRCKFLYQKTRVDNWESEPAKPMALGDLVHVGMATFHRRENPVTAMEAVFNERYVDKLELDEGEDPRTILRRAFAVVLGAIKFLGDDWETVSAPVFPENSEWHKLMDDPAVMFPLVEHELDHDMKSVDSASDPNHFVGIVDWVAREKATGQVWLFDYKVRGHIEQDINEDYNLQMAIYQYLLRQQGIPVIGSICFQMRSAAQQLPVLTQKGTMSKADIICSWNTYEKELIKHGLDPANYQDMKIKLGNKKFFQMSKSYRSPALLDRMWRDIIQPTLLDIHALRDRIYWDAVGNYVAPRSMNSMCKLCGVADRCQSHLRGVEDIYFNGANSSIKNDEVNTF